MPKLISGAEIVFKALEDQKVEYIFGYPGGAVLPIYDELKNHKSIKHILARHEQGAGHAAEGYARSSGKPGVLLVTSGPGATNAVTALTDAYMDSVPLVCISGQVPTHLIGTDAFQECDTTGITRPCTKHNWLVKDVKARVGDWVVAIGNPFGLGGTVTSGIVSARNRDIGMTRYDDFIQTDASINQGNSGGPLFNLKGEVVGINTAIIAPGQSGSIGIGFAIPSNAASKVIDQLVNYGETRRGWLGVRIQEVTKEIAEAVELKKPEGALVASVGEKSPADKAGIKAGDIILEFDGKKIDKMRTLPRVVANTKVGKNVKVQIWRNKKLISKNLKLGRLESSEEFKEKKSKQKKTEELEIEKLKITVRDLNEEDISSRKLKITKGVVITEISNKSPLKGELNINDIIIEVKRTPITKSSDLKEIIEKITKQGDKNLLLSIIDNNNRRRYIGIKLN